MVGGGRGGAGLVDGVGGGGAYRLVQPVGQAEHPAAVRLFRFSHLLPVCHAHQISGASVRLKKNLVPGLLAHLISDFSVPFQQIYFRFGLLISVTLPQLFPVF